MRILYDGQIYCLQSAGGINRYFQQLISFLPTDFEPIITTFRTHPDNWPSHPNLKVVQAPLFSPQRVARRVGRHYFQFASERLKPDLIHPTFYQLLTMKSLNSHNCPCVCTVHDFITDIFSSQLDPQKIATNRQTEAILAADFLLCNSQNTKKDLLERFPHLEPRVTVTPLAGDLDITMSYGEHVTPIRPYFLFVGSRAPYKNFDGLLRAFSRFVSAISGVALVVVGGPFDERELKLIQELKLESNVENWSRLSDKHLAKLYRCSLALVYPSFYEGFGIPLLEAMNCETIVIASNTSSIPEVVNDAALLFDPHQLNHLTDIMLGVAREEIDRSGYIKKGRVRASAFSWERTAQLTVEVYRNLSEQ